MKLGLADQLIPRPTAVLVLGEGALANQIQDDLRSLGLHALLVADLNLKDSEKRELPRVTDPDAGLQMRRIFEHFKKLDESEAYDHAWVHPGVTAWGERAELEGWARQSGLSAITSPTKNLQLFWNMQQTLRLAESVGVPTLVLSDEPITSVREIDRTIKNLLSESRAVLPFVLKSSYRVRGGYGVRVIRQVEELTEWVPIWMNQIQEISGATLLFFERFLEGARSYVQPFARLKTGEIELFPIVDASLTFEGKNWVEVCPAQGLDDFIEKKITNYSTKILKAADFVGVGNLCFLSSGSEVYFTEGLGRLNFAYSLWENIARTKAVQWQLYALAPSLLREKPKPKPKIKGPKIVGGVSPICGMNLKLFAEDTWLKIPHPGLVHEVSQKTEWNESSSEGVSEGHLIWDVIPSQNVDWKASGSLGQITLFSTDWHETLSMARKILKDIWISGGIQTNERFLAELLSHPWIEEAMFYTGFVDEEFIPKQIPEQALLQIMADALSEVLRPLKENESFLWMNHRLPEPQGRLKWTQRAELENNGLRGVKGFFHTEAGKTERICVFPIHATRFMIRIQNWFFSVRLSEKGKPLQLLALTSGRVHSVFFREESKVEAKHSVLILESHQKLISHRLPIPVKIKSLKIRAEDEVVIGEVLAELERWSDN